MGRRRGHGEDAIYFAAGKNRYIGAVPAGFGPDGKRLRGRFPAWQDSGLVFTTAVGTMLDQHNIRREFRQITKAAGLGEDWVPR